MDIWDKLMYDAAKRNGTRFISNEEFFSSNEKGCFYEGMERNKNGEWVPNAESRAREEKRQRELNQCYWCKKDPEDCNC